MRVLFGLTGASGHPVAIELIKRCAADEKFLVVSRWGEEVLRTETGLTVGDILPHVKKSFSNDDLSAPFSSGSTPLDAFVIVPCSVSTMGKIAAGIGDTLITRAAQVALKERRRLVIALRETPLSSVALEAALKLSRDGAHIVPLSPPFYTHPKSVDDIVGDMADRLLRSLGESAGKAWREEEL